MPHRSQKAVDAVGKLFKRKPGATTDEFLEVAIAADPSLDGIGKRSFNASYLLPLKRAANPRKRKKRGGSKAKRAARGAAAGKRTRGGASRRVKISTIARARLREMILQRDTRVLKTLGGDGDAQEAYELGAHLDDYIDEIAAAVRS